MTRIEEIEAREKAATKGPWAPSTILHLALKDDVDFAAHAREDIPYLLAELREARERLEVLEEVVREAGCNLPNPNGSRCGDCGNCRSDRILKGGD